MSDLVWDEAGTRYFETGTSKGILFPMGGDGVVWNGLVSVNIDPSGGEPEAYYFDGVKYMDRILAEEFQATISAITTPVEFEPCEGIQTPAPGMKTFFNKRDKFNMVWRTEIGNDQDPSLAYKIHIAYNCTVQPSARAYQTIADTTTLDVRSFVITTTPACGRHSYFVFDSREANLSALETQLYNGNLPRCWDLPGLVGFVGDPDDGCPSFVEDFEEYNPGEVLDVDTINPIFGQVNNGLDATELPVTGDEVDAVDSDATMVADSSATPLSDDSDASYVTSSGGDLGWSMPLTQMFGNTDGADVELHIRMSITGGVSADDPDNLDADAQVFICTDSDGDFPVGGFSDGTDEGFSFALSDVEGNPTDYVVPLSMDAWIGSTLADVFTALASDSAYLVVVAADNNNPDDDIEVRVYEASVVILNSSDQDKYLRFDPTTGPTTNAFISMDVYDTPGVHDEDPNTVYIDFKVIQTQPTPSADGFVQQVLTWSDDDDAVLPGLLQVELNVDNVPVLNWYDGSADDGGTVLDEILLDPNIWYSVIADRAALSTRVRVFERDSPDDVLLDNTQSVTVETVGYAMSKGGMVVNSEASYEVALDNARIQMHCDHGSPGG